ncbi:hypothetical protein HCA69_15965 [Listeria grandensis]|uniref:Uncharacterized protein n=1 Tax=Listeria grandensis TaxID=1494963 RepID=A0A7X0Y6F1_9LIST|nr:hypothetical protein [Listeria grandensis]MBC1937860.1 hypothetical protein [Listeria grandensis]
MTYSDKQVRWADALRREVFDSEALLLQCFEKELLASDVVEKDEVEALLQTWVHAVREMLAKQDALFFINKFGKHGTNPGEVHLFILRELQEEFPDYALSDLNGCFDRLESVHRE